MSGNPVGSPWRSTPAAARKRPAVNLTLPREVVAALDAARGDESRSAFVERAIRALLASP